MALNPGTRLGVYEVTVKIGEGGMGEVYQARDTKLDRNVALKVLPEAFTTDPDRLARFEREAKVLASLNHPNIGSIYGLEESESVRALVLELIDGPTLADRIKQGPIPIDEALSIAKQIAEALEAAHEQGVIHRDLKPANVKVKDDGTVKVLDFGLAKAFQPDPEGDPSQSPTLIAAATQHGVILGTAAYMSPEQARGKTVDKRADIWAFGVVLFEMVTGRRPFEGRDVSEVLGGVLRLEPEWNALPGDTPPRVSTLLRRCLEKEPKQRVHDVADVRLAMAGGFETTVSAPSDSVVEPQLQVWQRPLPALVVGLVLLFIGGLSVWILPRPDVIPPDLMRFTLVPPDTAPMSRSLDRDITIFPDGTQVVYGSRVGGEQQLILRHLGEVIGTPLRGTGGGRGPFVSPDGEWVGFVSNDQRTLHKASTSGGPPVRLYDSPTRIAGASWGTDDQIIFGGTAGGLLRVSGGGGEPTILTTPDTEGGERGHFWPSIIAGRNAVLFVISKGNMLTTGQLAVLNRDTEAVTQLGLAGVSPHYLPTGHLVYAALDGSLRAVPFDARTLEVTGNPVPLIEGVSVKTSGAANFSVSDNGRLVYTLGRTGDPVVLRSLVWVDRDGREESIAAAPRRYQEFSLSPDGTKVAIKITESDANDIWIVDLGLKQAQSPCTSHSTK